MQSDAPKNNRPFQEALRHIWNALHRRPIMKLGALLIAVVFWAIVIASDPSLTIERTILNAPVTISGLEALRSKGFTVMDDLSNGTITVKMRVEVKQADYDHATAAEFTPRLELSTQITHEGLQRVNITVPATPYGNVLSIEPEYVELEVEQFISRSRVPVDVQLTGESKSPVWLSNQSADPSHVSVSGPKSLVDKVYRAIAYLPQDGITGSESIYRISAPFELQDASGNTIPSSQLRVTNESIAVDSVRLEVDVYPMREIPVQQSSAVTGIPAHGYQVEAIRITPETVNVAANEALLHEIEALFLSAPVDISGADENVSVAAPLRSIAGAAHMATQEVMVEVDIAPAEHVHVYNDLPVTIMGLDPTMASTLSHQAMDVIIRGNYDKVQMLEKSDISLFVNANGLTEGKHTLDVQCVVNGPDAYTFEPEFPRVILTLTKEST